MRNRFTILVITILMSPLCWGQAADRINTPANPTTVIGPRNIALYDGAQALMAGESEEGVKLTLLGLEVAQGRREEEAALSNLCAGYIKLRKYNDALTYCERLLQQNDKNWRGYNNRAVIYIQTKQWEKAEQDLIMGEELNPGARTMKIARSMYMDAVHPVREEVEIDDRQDENIDEAE